jgi:hypothetical protein
VLENLYHFCTANRRGLEKFFVHQPWYFMAAAVATLGSTLVFHGSVPPVLSWHPILKRFLKLFFFTMVHMLRYYQKYSGTCNNAEGD